MPGVRKNHKGRKFGRDFPASRYNDPRGGRPSALERNVLRYRAIEAALFLFYNEDVRAFMTDSVWGKMPKQPGTAAWNADQANELVGRFTAIVAKAKREGTLSDIDARALCSALKTDRRQGKQLRDAFGYAVEIGIFTQTEAEELQDLLEYRNTIAHRIHLVMADISRTQWSSDHIDFAGPSYKEEALDRLRAYRNSLWDRAGSKVVLIMPWKDILFGMAERAFEDDLKRLEKLIQRQIARENAMLTTIRAETNLKGTEFVGDLHPRFPFNHRQPRPYRDEYVPPTGHLTPRGVEICFRLFDHGKSPLAVAWLMGISLAAAKNRQRGWAKVGGVDRVRVELERYDTRTGRKLEAA